MFYLMKHSTHLYLRLDSVRYMVNHQSEKKIERGNLVPPLHGLLFQVRSGKVRSGQVRVFNVHIQSKLI